MYIEIGFLVVIILAVSLFYNVTPDDNSEGFQQDEFEILSSMKGDYVQSLGKVDLRIERQKLLDELGRVDVATHEYAQSSDRSSVRVGLERMIAEIDRALETEGRYLETKKLEAILRSGRNSLV